MDERRTEGNADGVLTSDEAAESHDKLLIRNTIKNNPYVHHPASRNSD